MASALARGWCTVAITAGRDRTTQQQLALGQHPESGNGDDRTCATLLHCQALEDGHHHQRARRIQTCKSGNHKDELEQAVCSKDAIQCGTGGRLIEEDQRRVVQQLDADGQTTALA